jgi:DNA-binding response OmpR family regulator
MSKLRVLIIDDDRVDLNHVARALDHADIEYKTCDESTEAMDLIYEYQPTLVILDVNMPRIDGIEICETIKKDSSLSHIMVMFMTASTSFEDVLKGVRLQIVDYIEKSVPVTELLEHILVHDLSMTLKNSYKNFEEQIERNSEKYK